MNKMLSTPDLYRDSVEEGASSGGILSRQINLRDLWPPIYRSRFVILAIMAAVISLAVVATLLSKPTYRSTATVEIKQEAQKVLGTEDAQERGTGPADADKFLATQLDIISSRSTTEAVAQSLGLYANNGFLTAMGQRPSDELSPTDRKRAVEGLLQQNLSVAFSENTRIARISFDSPDPDVAAKVANSFADNYIRLNLARRFDASRYSLDFLRDQIREAQARLGESERGALDYARRARVVDASNAATGTGGGAAPRSLTLATLVQLNDSLAQATAKRIAAQQKWEATQRVSLTDIPEVLANPAIQQLAQERATLRSQYAEQRQYRQADYPAVQQLAARIGELDTQIGRLAGDVRDGFRSDFQIARSQEQGLSTQLDRLKGVSLDEQDRGIQLSILQRGANTNRQQLDALLTRYNEVNAQSGVQLNNLSIIDRGEVPQRPVWPKPILNLFLALVVGLLASGAYVLGREHLFERVRTPDDVTARLHLPVLGSIPPATEAVAAMADPKSTVSEALSTIRTALSLTSTNGVPASLMVTSTQASEGKTTVCYGLAGTLAKTGRRVLMIDADLRRPNVHRTVGVKNERGFSNVLAGEPLAGMIHRDERAGIDVLTAGPIPPDPAELLASQRLRDVIAELSREYDHVLVDSAPLLGLADAPLVATGVQGVVFVIESARSSARWIDTALARLRQTGVPILGAVVSRFDPGRHGYSYEYKVNYEYDYARKPS